MTGIYRLVSPEGHVYFGQAICLENRRKDHFQALAKGSHYNKHVQAVYDKHGLVFEPILVCEPEELDIYEQCLLDKFFDDPKCMNQAKDVRAPARTPEIAAKISDTLKRKGIRPPSQLGVRRGRFSRSVVITGKCVRGESETWKSYEEFADFFGYKCISAARRNLTGKRIRIGKCRGWTFTLVDSGESSTPQREHRCKYLKKQSGILGCPLENSTF